VQAWSPELKSQSHKKQTTTKKQAFNIVRKNTKIVGTEIDF
jgi:hypothetical protein